MRIGVHDRDPKSDEITQRIHVARRGGGAHPSRSQHSTLDHSTGAGSGSGDADEVYAEAGASVGRNCGGVRGSI